MRSPPIVTRNGRLQRSLFPSSAEVASSVKEVTRMTQGNFLTFFCLFSFVIALMSISCTQSSRPPVNGTHESPATPQPKTESVTNRVEESATQTYRGVQVTILEIQRAKEVEVMPNFPEKIRAKQGHEFALLRFRVKVLEAGKNLEVGQLKLLDAQGNKNKCTYERTDLCEAAQGEETICTLPFAVPEGARLTSLQFGDQFVDLENVAIKK